LDAFFGQCAIAFEDPNASNSMVARLRSLSARTVLISPNAPMSLVQYGTHPRCPHYHSSWSICGRLGIR
jgi:hypothetical protein